MSKANSSAVSYWCTGSAAPHERFDCYASVLAEAVTPMSLRSDDPSRFQAEVESIQLGSIDVLKMSGAPHEVLRGEPEISRSQARTFHLLINTRSEMRLSHRGTSRVPAGDAVLVDSALGHQLQLPQDYEILHLRMGESFINRWLPRPHVLVGKLIPARAGWGSALCAAVGQLTPRFLATAPLPASLLEEQVGALLALTASTLSERAAEPGTPAALAERIRDCLKHLCADPEVTAQSVAQALNVSVRTVHRALTSTGETFGALLVTQRVELAGRMLLSSSFKHLTTAEIGRRAGFSDPSHFVRVFKRYTGQTPAERRRL